MMTQANSRKKVAFILGAGFSKCADLPVQAEFSPLLTSSKFDSSFDREITANIKKFLKSAFGWKEKREIPSLEDVFTFIDLSLVNSHYLGCHYSPAMLDSLRKMLIYRIFQILDNQFSICQEILDLLAHYQQDDCSFIVMNWDIVLEKHLLELNSSTYINYITPSYDWHNQRSGNPGHGIKVCKMHGSSNWVYCENCKALFYQLDKKLSLHKKVGLVKQDFRLFNEAFADAHFGDTTSKGGGDNSCQQCHNILSSHIATFSYRKSFRTAAYSAIWHEAENLLTNADKWIFVGYSLPEADFELKHLIKSAQLRVPDSSPKEVEAILYQDEYASDKFRRFFGDENVRVYENGFTEYIRHLKK